MPTVAEQLRRAREQQNLNIYEVAEITKIRTDHIRALEAGQYETFSAPVYIRGFVRNYARALKLDEVRLVADLEGELSHSEKFREPPPLTNQPRSSLDYLMLQLSRLSWRTFTVIAVVAAGLIAGGILLSQSRHQMRTDPLKNLGPGLYQPREAQSGELLPLPTNPPAPVRTH